MTITTAEERQAPPEVQDQPESGTAARARSASPPGGLVSKPARRWADDEPAETPPARRSWLALFAWAKVAGGW
jgi:hypothetical protein